MNTKLTVENIGPAALLCTLDFPDMGRQQALRITMEIPKDPNRTVPQLEFQLLEKARDLLAQICSVHPECKRE